MKQTLFSKYLIHIFFILVFKVYELLTVLCFIYIFRLCHCGRVHQFCSLLPLWASGGGAKYQHPVLDAADIWPSAGVRWDSGPASGSGYHDSCVLLKEPGVPFYQGLHALSVSI